MDKEKMALCLRLVKMMLPIMESKRQTIYLLEDLPSSKPGNKDVFESISLLSYQNVIMEKGLTRLNEYLENELNKQE